MSPSCQGPQQSYPPAPVVVPTSSEVAPAPLSPQAWASRAYQGAADSRIYDVTPAQLKLESHLAAMAIWHKIGVVFFVLGFLGALVGLSRVYRVDITAIIVFGVLAITMAGLALLYGWLGKSLKALADGARIVYLVLSALGIVGPALLWFVFLALLGVGDPNQRVAALTEVLVLPAVVGVLAYRIYVLYQARSITTEAYRTARSQIHQTTSPYASIFFWYPFALCAYCFVVAFIVVVLTAGGRH